MIVANRSRIPVLKGIWFYALALVMVAVLASCGRQPGYTLVAPETKVLEIDGRFIAGVEAPTPYARALPPNRRVWLWVGNRESGARTVRVHGAQPAVLNLPARSWSRHELSVTEPAATFAWEGEPLWFGEPFVLPEGTTDRPNVLLISIDTLRYDLFDSEHMPRLAASFALNGRLFERAYTTAPWTLPAHASMLTGLSPVKHGVRLPQQLLSDDAVTLAETMRDAGYYAMAFTEGNYVSGRYGLSQGFHDFVEDPPRMMEKDPEAISRLAPNMARLDRALVDSDQAPLFVFLHTYEVHCPYLPRDGRSDPEGIGMTGWLLEHEFDPPTPAQIDLLRDLYEGELAYTDGLIGPLVERLLARGDWTILLTSDHGEEFGEHGGLLHADTLYEEVMHVPFALAGAGIEPAPPSTDLVSILDIPPTIAAITKTPPRDDWEGRNLLSSEPSGATPTPHFGETFFLGPHVPAEDPRLVAVWQGQDKLIQSRKGETYGAELFRLDLDPLERQNRAESELQRRDALFLFMQAYLEGRGLDAGDVGELTPEQLEVMRSLGYAE
ncbi:Sulfatase [Sulfidibacter corallicola]|uniref:Sulfatase n=1 Tax=Sulfidibacter corallicola TaxID=2818388 RepID=A0A8A4TVC0_SULCO|nr:sulfatase [Sulfidibacter corallicola]QTD53307.1 sulfatase [Sulfidibacter corallicola]